MYPDACCKIPKVAQEDEIVAGCMQTYGEQTVRERADANDLDRGCVSKFYQTLPPIIHFLSFSASRSAF